MALIPLTAEWREARRRRLEARRRRDYTGLQSAATRFVYPMPPRRQPKQGPAVVGESDMLSIPAFFAGMRTVAGMVARLPVMDADTGKEINRKSGFFFKPTETGSWPSLMRATMMNLQQHGRAYQVIQDLDGMGRIAKVHLVNPAYVSAERHRQLYQLEFRIGNEVFTPWDVIHFKAIEIGGFDEGVSPLVMLSRMMQVHVSESELVRTTYESGGLPQQGYLTSPMELDPTDLNTTAGRFYEAMGGRGSNGVLAMDKNFRWEIPGMTFEDLAMLASRQWSATEAAMVLGIPPHLIGAPTYDSQTYSNVIQSLQGYARIGLADWRNILQSTYQLHGVNVELADTDLTRAPRHERMPQLIQAYNAGLITKNEFREEVDWEPVDDGDEFKMIAPVDVENDNKNESDPASNGSKPGTPANTPRPQAPTMVKAGTGGNGARARSG